MNLAFVGYGKMGKEIEQVALERGHRIVSRIDLDNRDELGNEVFSQSDAAFEFTRPDTAVRNILDCFAAGVPVVCGTTGWLDRLPEVTRACEERGLAFFHASNFSLGMNILFWLNRELAGKMNAFDQYDVRIDEIHHTQKLDAPSGTAIVLAKEILGKLDRKTEWVLGKEGSPDQLCIQAFREGTVPGTHTVKYESDFDEITLGHAARNRKGFALGAVLAAEFLQSRKGCFSMKDLLNF